MTTIELEKKFLKSPYLFKINSKLVVNKFNISIEEVKYVKRKISYEIIRPFKYIGKNCDFYNKQYLQTIYKKYNKYIYSVKNIFK